MTAVTLLGPQAPQSNLRQALSSVEHDAPLVCITAGWREREGEIDDLAHEIGRPVTDLRLYERANAVCAADRPLADALRERQEQLKEQQRLYRLRLQHAADAALELLVKEDASPILRVEQRAAIAQLRTLDRHHLRRIAQTHARFEQAWKPWQRSAMSAQLAAVQHDIERAGAVLVAGGHVAVLLNRMRLFGVDSMLGERPLIGWSAGAMIMGQQIVLYHDRAPEGRRNAEVLGDGLSRVRGLVALPDADRRLDRDDRNWLALMARRFSPMKCTTLNPGALIRFDGEQLSGAEQVTRITPQGRLKQVRAK